MPRARLTPTQTPEALASLLAPLPAPTAASVVRAYDAWVTAGLPKELATRRAVKLARKVTAKHHAQLRRTQGSLVSRAAARHERRMQRHVLDAVATAQASLPLAQLANQLQSRSVSMQLIDSIVESFGDAFNGEAV